MRRVRKVDKGKGRMAMAGGREKRRGRKGSYGGWEYE